MTLATRRPMSPTILSWAMERPDPGHRQSCVGKQAPNMGIASKSGMATHLIARLKVRR